MTEQPRRWSWFDQARDALLTIIGIVVILVMLWRNSWPPLGVATAMVCVGALTASGLLRFLIGRSGAKE